MLFEMLTFCYQVLKVKFYIDEEKIGEEKGVVNLIMGETGQVFTQDPLTLAL